MSHLIMDEMFAVGSECEYEGEGEGKCECECACACVETAEVKEKK